MHKQFMFDHVRPSPGAVLVIGSRIEGLADWRERHPAGLGVDMRPGPGVNIEQDLEQPLSGVLETARFGHIECTSVVEHSRRPWLLAANIERLLKPGGSLYFSAPFIWRWHGYPGDYWRITHQTLPVLFPSIDWLRVSYITGGGGEVEAPAFDEPYKVGKPGCVNGHHLLRHEVVAFGRKVEA